MSGRIRSIKPEWLEDEKIALASLEARVLSVALLLIADDHGNGRAHPRILTAKVFPLGDVSVTERALRELVDLRFIRLYVADDQQYFSIRRWKEHQRVDKPGKPRVPLPPESASTSQEIPANPREEILGSTGHQESLAPDQEHRSVGSGAGAERLARESPRASPEPEPEPEPDDPGSGIRESPSRAPPGAFMRLAEFLRDGVAQGFDGLGEPVPLECRDLTWPGWVRFARWVREKASKSGRDDLEIGAQAIRSFFGSTKAEQRGYPVSFLVKNPLEFWKDAA